MKRTGVFFVAAAVLMTACQKKAEPPAGALPAEVAGGAPQRPFVYVAQQLVNSIDPAKVIDETEIIAAWGEPFNFHS